MRRLLAPVLALSALTLSACGVRADAHYDDPDEIREALVNEGFACHGSSSAFGDDVELLECDSGIGIYTWEESASEESAELKSVLGEHAGGSDYVVASDTWALTHERRDQATELQETFGGELIGAEDLAEYLSALQVAYASCDGESSETVSYDDEYKVLTIDSAFEEAYSVDGFTDRGMEAAVAFECVMNDIEMPAHVRNDIERTRAMDGTRDTEWGGFSASWNYHPDSGLNIQITDES